MASVLPSEVSKLQMRPCFQGRNVRRENCSYVRTILWSARWRAHWVVVVGVYSSISGIYVRYHEDVNEKSNGAKLDPCGSTGDGYAIRDQCHHQR